MENDNDTLYRIFAGRTVQLTFGGLFVIWVLFAANLIPNALYGILLPLWMPSYISFAVASGIRNTVLPSLGSGLFFTGVTFIITYFEAVLLAGAFRFLRATYRTYESGKEETEKTA